MLSNLIHSVNRYISSTVRDTWWKRIIIIICNNVDLGCHQSITDFSPTYLPIAEANNPWWVASEATSDCESAAAPMYTT
jgi:hypothetical protein